jgi:hypothetical protein
MDLAAGQVKVIALIETPLVSAPRMKSRQPAEGFSTSSRSEAVDLALAVD